MNKNFVVFILTHGRPDNVKTLKTLRRCGYTGEIYYVVDNEDKKVQRYIQKFGKDRVRIFDKKAYADSIDEGNNFDERRTITHARNACFDIAEDLGYKYFIELDDDYTAFEWRYEEGGKLKVLGISNLDKILSLYLDFYKKTPFSSIAFAQGGDFIGGVGNTTVRTRAMKRKAMNSFICSPKRRFQFVGAMNEDVNTYTTLGSRGVLFGTVPMISLTQTATQSGESGITDMYLRYGTYAKSFTTVMMHPSSVKVSMMKSRQMRIHHAIKWINTAPMILSDKYRISKERPTDLFAQKEIQNFNLVLILEL